MGKTIIFQNNILSTQEYKCKIYNITSSLFMNLCNILRMWIQNKNLTWFFDDYNFTMTKHDDLLVATDVIFDLANTSDWGGTLLSNASISMTKKYFVVLNVIRPYSDHVWCH